MFEKIVMNGLFVSHFESVELVLTSFILSYFLLVLHCLTKVDCPVLQPLFLRNAHFKKWMLYQEVIKLFSCSANEMSTAHKLVKNSGSGKTQNLVIYHAHK